MIKRFQNLSKYMPEILLGLVILTFGTACTTVEGTNAFADGNTFEREVMKETLRGIGLIDREKKEVETNQRPKLVVPKNTAQLPLPGQVGVADLPQDSDRVDYDRTTLSEAQIQRLTRARVVEDTTFPKGRPLTAREYRILSERMADYLERRKQARTVRRELYQPPEEYLVTGSGQSGDENKDLICLTTEDELVSIDDPKCPSDIRAALNQN